MPVTWTSPDRSPGTRANDRKLTRAVTGICACHLDHPDWSPGTRANDCKLARAVTGIRRRRDVASAALSRRSVPWVLQCLRPPSCIPPPQRWSASLATGRQGLLPHTPFTPPRQADGTGCLVVRHLTDIVATLQGMTPFVLIGEDSGTSFEDSLPVCVCVFFKTGDQLAHTNSTFYARICPQWLSEMRRLRPSVS